MNKSVVEKITQKAILYKDLSSDTIYELCPHPTKQNCNKSWCKGNTDFCHKKIDVILLTDVLKILEDYDIKPLTDIRIRKVKILRGRAKEEAEKRGLKPNDLVIVTTTITNSLPEYYIEKIDGDPVSYLLKCDNTFDKFVVVPKQKLHELADLVKTRPKTVYDNPEMETDPEMHEWVEYCEKIKKFVEAFGESARKKEK